MTTWLKRWPVSALIAIAIFAIAVGVWFAVTPTLVPELIFPSPLSVRGAMRSLGSGLWWHAAATLGRVALGWSIGVPLGVLMGFALSSNVIFRAIAHPVIEVLRPLPPVALIPFFI